MHPPFRNSGSSKRRFLQVEIVRVCLDYKACFSLKFDPLNGFNYHTWKCKMEDLLYINHLHLRVFATEKPEDMSEQHWTLLHRQVCGYIRQWVDDNVLNHISEEKHAQTLWNKLRQLYAPRKTGGNDKMFLMKQLMTLRYQDATPLTPHLEIFQGIINQLAGKIDDEIQGFCLLATLPDSWERFTMSLLSYSALNGVINMDLAKTSILNEEMRIKSILVTERRGCKNKGKATAELCYHYGEKGHIRKYCRHFHVFLLLATMSVTVSMQKPLYLLS